MFIYSGILFHPVHVSITNINFNSELNSVEISFQFFAEDLKNTVLYNTGTSIILNDKQEPDEESIRAINKYVFSNFEIIINGENEINFGFQSLKKNEEYIWIYYESEDITGMINNIVIQNTLMLDIYADQKNLLILDIDGVERGYTFNFSKNNIDVIL